jgi:nitrate/nitrite transport system substrate-binding protein
VNFPRRAYGMWFLAQYQRFGYLTSAPDYNGLVNSIILSDLYKQVAKAKRIPIPGDDMASIHIKLDGAVFDPRNPAKEAARA